MKLKLAQLPALRWYGGVVPAWQRYLAPDAAKSLLEIETAEPLVYTDIWRSAEVSLHARAQKTGVQPPGFSAHNYGFAVDLTVDQILKEKQWSYNQLLAFMEGFGWFCHRRDGKLGSESWHFNYLGPDPKAYIDRADPKRAVTWDEPVEQRILEQYSFEFDMAPLQAQQSLQQLRLYNGPLDGIVGPITHQAIIAFQRAWRLAHTGRLDARTLRTLAFVCAEKEVVAL